MQRRPGFPARLDRPPAGVVATSAAMTRPVQRAAPQGVGLDSAAVRARMVQRLSDSGIRSAAVLQAFPQHGSLHARVMR